MRRMRTTSPGYQRPSTAVGQRGRAKGQERGATRVRGSFRSVTEAALVLSARLSHPGERRAEADGEKGKERRREDLADSVEAEG